MKKILTGIVFTVFLTANLYAQTGTWQLVANPNGLASNYDQMVFPTLNGGFIYGSFSNAISDLQSTTDSGVDFNSVIIQTTGLKSPSFGPCMAWPTAQNGYLCADTGIFPGPTGSFSIHTSNGGTSWTTSVIDSGYQLQNLYFSSANVGYATGSTPDGSENIVSKTTDGGNTWKTIYSNSKSGYYFGGNIGKLHFIDDNNGMFSAQSSTNQLLIGYTTNGGASFKFVTINTDSTPNFLHWNNDSSWLVGADQVYRSIDSGQHWTSVVPYDTLAGSPVVGTFFNDTGFVFRSIEPLVLMTTNAGVSWSQTRLPNNGSTADSVTPLSASMPSSHVAYLLANDYFATADVLLKIEFATPVDTGGGKDGVVDENTAPSIPFAAIIGTNNITFTMAAASDARSIEVMDVLGRSCATISIAANATRTQLPSSELRSGTYFAQLGGSVVKFVIP